MSAVPVCPPPGQVNLLWFDISLDRLSGHPPIGFGRLTNCYIETAGVGVSIHWSR
jgi:hypothetical protein